MTTISWSTDVNNHGEIEICEVRNSVTYVHMAENNPNGRMTDIGHFENWQ